MLLGGGEQETGMGREQEAKTGREQMQGTVLIQSTAHRGTGILPFFAKRKRKRRGGQASVPLHPLLPGEGSPRTPPRREGFYVSSVIILLGPPGPIPRRACCGRCVGWAAYGQVRPGRRQGKNWDRAKSRCGEKLKRWEGLRAEAINGAYSSYRA